jgi:hypothetical protein
MNKLIVDKFRANRPQWTRIKNISCEKCKAHVCFYQKDGPGELRRMYIDRILESKVNLYSNELLCPNKHILGIKINLL